MRNPCAPWTHSAYSTFEVTQTRSLVITPTHTSMFQVLTGTRSRRAHRMWPDLNISSSERGRALQPNPASEWIPSTGAAAEKIFNGVRLSYRERKPCHRPAYEVGASYGHDRCSRALGGDGKPVHAHTTWSDLHVYVAKKRA